MAYDYRWHYLSEDPKDMPEYNDDPILAYSSWGEYRGMYAYQFKRYGYNPMKKQGWLAWKYVKPVEKDRL